MKRFVLPILVLVVLCLKVSLLILSPWHHHGETDSIASLCCSGTGFYGSVLSPKASDAIWGNPWIHVRYCLYGCLRSIRAWIAGRMLYRIKTNEDFSAKYAYRNLHVAISCSHY